MADKEQKDTENLIIENLNNVFDKNEERIILVKVPISHMNDRDVNIHMRTLTDQLRSLKAFKGYELIVIPQIDGESIHFSKISEDHMNMNGWYKRKHKRKLIRIHKKK